MAGLQPGDPYLPSTDKEAVTGEPSWEPSARTTSTARRTGMDRRLMIMPGHGPIRTTLNGLTGIYGLDDWELGSCRFASW